MPDSQFYTILTDRGREKLRAAIVSGEKLQLTHMAVGDGAGDAIQPVDDMTALVNEVYRGPITNNSIDPNNPTWTVLNLVIPVDVGGWYVREAGIFDSEGELIFIGSLPENYKALPTQGVASDLSVNLIVDIQRADSVTIVVDPATVLASQEWTGQVIESFMRLHDEDPAAHEALVDKLAQTGRMMGREEVQEEVKDSLRELLVESGSDILTEAGLVRERVTDVLTVQMYVDAAQGNDDNDGFSQETALKSFDGLVKRMRGLDLADSYRLDVHFAAGEYDSQRSLLFLTIGDLPTGVPLDITIRSKEGAVFTHSSNRAFYLIHMPRTRLEGITLAYGLDVRDSSTCWVLDCVIHGREEGPFMTADRGGVIIIENVTKFTGTGTYLFLVSTGSAIHVQSDITLEDASVTNTPAWLRYGGQFTTYAITMHGTLTVPDACQGFCTSDRGACANPGSMTFTLSNGATALEVPANSGVVGGRNLPKFRAVIIGSNGSLSGGWHFGISHVSRESTGVYLLSVNTSYVPQVAVSLQNTGSTQACYHDIVITAGPHGTRNLRITCTDAQKNPADPSQLMVVGY